MNNAMQVEFPGQHFEGISKQFLPDRPMVFEENKKPAFKTWFCMGLCCFQLMTQ